MSKTIVKPTILGIMLCVFSIGMLFGITTSQTNVLAENDLVPDWVKNNAGWWSDGQITEVDYLQGIEWLISEGIIQVPAAEAIYQSKINDLQNEIDDIQNRLDEIDVSKASIKVVHLQDGENGWIPDEQRRDFGISESSLTNESIIILTPHHTNPYNMQSDCEVNMINPDQRFQISCNGRDIPYDGAELNYAIINP